MDTTQFVIDTNTHTEIVQSLAEKLQAYYVFPDIAKQISVRLQKHLEGGEYTDITEGELFSKILTEHIQEVNQDKHLIVRWYPEPLPDCEGPIDIFRNNKLVRDAIARLGVLTTIRLRMLVKIG